MWCTLNTKPRNHCELIKAWADGAEIERYYATNNCWETIANPSWGADAIYRIKTRTYAFRLALCKSSIPLHNDTKKYLYAFNVSRNEEYDEKTDPDFVRWLTDWIEVKDE